MNPLTDYRGWPFSTNMSSLLKEKSDSIDYLMGHCKKVSDIVITIDNFQKVYISICFSLSLLLVAY